MNKKVRNLRSCLFVFCIFWKLIHTYTTIYTSLSVKEQLKDIHQIVSVQKKNE